MYQEEHLVFISYTSGDRERVEPIVDMLLSSGVDAWVDIRRLKAGQNWDFEIRRALDKAAIIVVFISNKSVTKRGYVQREIRISLEKAEEKLIDDIYLIPVILDEDVVVPDLIKDLQFIRFGDENFQNNLLDAIRHQQERLGTAIETAQNTSEVRWQFYSYRENRDGVPGYEADFRMIRLSSEQYPMISQVGDIIRGDLLRKISGLRYNTTEPDTNFFNFGQEKFRRTHTLDASPQTPKFRGRVVSILYWLHSYYAGAAHPFHNVETYSFLVDPLCFIERVESIFTKEDEAFILIQERVRSQLLTPRIGEGEEYSLLPDVVYAGTESWNEFQAFVFDEKGIEFHFPPYQVASYADGAQIAHVEYEMIEHLITPLFKAALDIEYLKYRKSTADE